MRPTQAIINRQITRMGEGTRKPGRRNQETKLKNNTGESGMTIQTICQCLSARDLKSWDPNRCARLGWQAKGWWMAGSLDGWMDRWTDRWMWHTLFFLQSPQCKVDPLHWKAALCSCSNIIFYKALNAAYGISIRVGLQSLNYMVMKDTLTALSIWSQ